MAKALIASLELQRSMNLQARVMTIEETLRHSRVIDTLDDKRRENLHEIINWTKEQHLIFKELITNEVLKDKFEKFITRFSSAIDLVLEKELHLENIDDQNREFLLDYIISTREKLRNENSEFEKEIIMRRITK